MDKVSGSHDAIFVFWRRSIQSPQVKPGWHPETSVECHWDRRRRGTYHFDVRASDSRYRARPAMTVQIKLSASYSKPK